MVKLYIRGGPIEIFQSLWSHLKIGPQVGPTKCPHGDYLEKGLKGLDCR